MAHRHPRVITIDSDVLRSNALGDASERDVWVCTPPDYDRAGPLPALFALAGFTGNGAMLVNADALGDTLGVRLDRLSRAEA